MQFTVYIKLITSWHFRWIKCLWYHPSTHKIHSTSISSSNSIGNSPSPSTPNSRFFSAESARTPQHTIGNQSLSKLIFEETDDIGGDQGSVSPSLPEEEEQTTVINTDDSCLFTEDQQQMSDLQTSYGKAVAKAIGRSEEVLRFDKLRAEMKSNSNCRIMREQHDRLLSQLQVTLLRARTEKLKLQKVEKCYYLRYKHTPNKNDLSTEYGQLMKGYHYICKLLLKLNVEL